MYERFTDRARKVMQLANTEAVALNHEYIGTEHVLLGLLKEGNGVAANVLKNFDIDLDRVHAEMAKFKTSTVEEPVIIGRLPHSPRTKKLIEYAIEEAKSFHHDYVGTEHMLLGLLRDQEGFGAVLIATCGVYLIDVRKEVIRYLTPVPEVHQSATAWPLGNPRLDQADVFSLVQAERAYQDVKWGIVAEHPHEVGAWLLIMKGKLDAAITAWQGSPNDLATLDNLLKAIAVGMACLEQHGGALLLQMFRDIEFTRTNCGYMSPSKRSECYIPIVDAIRERMKQDAAKKAEEAARQSESLRKSLQEL